MITAETKRENTCAERAGPEHPRSTLISRNVVVSGRRTSIRLEPEMWDGLREICQRERSTVHQICTTVSLQKQDKTSLTAAIRVFVMRYFRLASTEEGHARAGHGYGLTLGLSMNGNAGYERRHFGGTLTKTSFA
jgi:predicted DNA-binding ribbon-helix-helix protein